MKKFFPILFLFIMVINEFNFFTIYLPLITINKSIQELNININELAVIRIPIDDFLNNKNNFEKINSQEFRYYSSVYDIYNINYEKEYVVIYCLYDDTENSLDLSFNPYDINQLPKNFSYNFYNILSNRKPEYYFITNIFLNRLELLNFLNPVLDNLCLNPFLKINTPPPKLS